MNIVDDFLALYERQYDYYQQLAGLCAAMCRDGLVDAGIRAMTTSRPKAYASLHKKRTSRHTEKQYGSFDDIYRDIADLAGVRVALYVPEGSARTRSFIKNTFLYDSSKVFPEDKGGSGERPEPWRIKTRFSGYGAEHFRIRLRKEALRVDQQRYGANQIEIQVASVLMYAVAWLAEEGIEPVGR